MFAMKAFTLLCASLAAVRATPCEGKSHARSDPVRLIHQFDLGVNLENIAVRSNGQLLLTAYAANTLYIADPSGSPAPFVAYNFNATSLAGIAEYKQDVFAVLGGVPTSGKSTLTWSVWSIDLQGASISGNTLSKPPVVTKIATIPEGFFLNGMSLLSSADGTLLVGDAQTGVIRVVNVNTGAYSVAINNTITAAGPANYIGYAGTNGLRVQNGYAYIANREAFAKIPITRQGLPTAEGSVIGHTINSTLLFDDFALDCNGAGYLASGPGNSIELITPLGQESIIAGSLNSTLIAEPTSAHFGRLASDSNILYVTTVGGQLVPVNGNTKIGAQLLAITTDTLGCFSLEPYY